jgi:predicted membrane protein
MRTQFLIATLLLVLIQSCTDSSDKDRIIHSNLDVIIQENSSWRNDLKNYNENIDVTQTELRRRFFSNSATSHDVYLHVSSIAQYFNYNDEILLEYNILLDEREKIIAPFYKCDKLSKESMMELITVEDKIVSTLKSLKKR